MTVSNREARVLIDYPRAVRGANRSMVRDTRVVRATGLQGDSSIEIIDVIDDDADPFGNRAPNATLHDAGGPRWAGPAAGAALVALLLYGVATSASSSGVPKVAPAPSTIATPTTLHPITTTTLDPQPVVPYYTADPPRQFSVSYADFQPADPNYYGAGSFQLLAKPNSTATSGTWLSIETSSGGLPGVYALDAYRAQADRRTMAISHLPTGQSVAQFAAGPSTSITLTSFGLSDDELIGLVGTISVEDDNVHFANPSLVGGYQVVSNVYPWLAVQGTPLEQVTYTDGNNPFSGININVALRPPTNAGGDTLDRQTALKFFLAHGTTFGVDGHVAVAGSVIGARGYAIATWIAGDHIVTIGATMPVQELMAIARTVHEVSADEWDGMKFQAVRHSSDNNFGNFEQTDAVPVSYGTDANADEWVIQVGIATFGDQKQANWQWDGNGFNWPVDGAARINSVVENRRTYVLATLPRILAPTGQLEISRPGLDPVVVAFVDTDPSLDRTFAAYAFSEPTQYAVQIVGPDGAVLANWRS